MTTNNFTFSNEWKNAICLRYPINEIVEILDLSFWKDGNVLKCQHFFNFEISDNVLERLSEYIMNGNTIKFSYIDDDTLYKKLSLWCDKKGYQFKIIDEWSAPKLKLESNTTNIKDYLNKNSNHQIKRNYRKYNENKIKYTFLVSNKDNVFNLWKDVLEIDINSWKGKDKCDMKSLNREDLQYIFYLIKNDKDASLNVLYKEKEPLAYSLMFKSKENSMWYAVKWGSSFNGRTELSGFYCLFNHLEKLYDIDNNINLDFWGRRSETYDYLKNNDMKRFHIGIGK